jgi:hypothetical protein
MNGTKLAEIATNAIGKCHVSMIFDFLNFLAYGDFPKGMDNNIVERLMN